MWRLIDSPFWFWYVLVGMVGGFLQVATGYALPVWTIWAMMGVGAAFSVIFLLIEHRRR
jgi:hypothetical protein